MVCVSILAGDFLGEGHPCTGACYSTGSIDEDSIGDGWVQLLVGSLDFWGCGNQGKPLRAWVLCEGVWS